MATTTTQLVDAISTETTASPTTLPVVDTSDKNATSPDAGNNPTLNSPTNVPIYASGNATKAQTAIKKSNQTISHACDSSTYVGKAVFQAGAFGGQIIQAIRNGIKAILAYFKLNPSSSAITSQLKKIAQDVKDISKFIKETTDALKGYLLYVAEIQKLISYILSLPNQLLAYFADCIKTLQKQLVAGYLSALSEVPDPSSETINELQSATKELQSSVSQLQSSATELTATVQSGITSVTSLTSLTTVDTTGSATVEAINNAATEYYTNAGYGPTTDNFEKA